MEEELFSLRDVAEILSVPPRTIHQWMKQGVLTPHRVQGEFRFRLQDIRSLSEDHPAGLLEPKKRILVLEDDPLVAQSLKNLLEKAGFEVSTASIGLAALDLAATARFDLVIADIRMPGMSGIETLKAIRQLRSEFGGRPTPEIILTAYDDPAVKREAERMGIRDFVLKPFEVDFFLALVRQRLKCPEALVK